MVSFGKGSVARGARFPLVDRDEVVGVGGEGVAARHGLKTRTVASGRRVDRRSSR